MLAERLELNKQPQEKRKSQILVYPTGDRANNETANNNSLQDNEEFDLYLNDALKRYKEINNGAVFNTARADSFLRVLKNLCNTMGLQPYIIFNKFAAKVQFTFNDKDFVLDYDHEEPNTVFILSSKDGTLIVKESTLDKLEETIRSF
jgi:hypothetical protein